MAQGATAQARSTPEVRRVVFEGTGSLDIGIIRQSLQTRPTRCRSPLFVLACRLGDFGWAKVRTVLDTAEVRRDGERLTLLYEAWGFPDARVTTELTRQGDDVGVTFRVEEGAPIVVRSIQVKGTDAIASFQLPRPAPLRAGEPYALPRLQTFESLVYAELARRGHPLATIEISGNVAEPARAAEIVLEVKPGRAAVFGTTRIQSQAPIGESVVRSRLAYRSGDRFSVEALERTERNLYALPITARASAQVSRSTRNDSVIDVDVRVDARQRHGFSGEALLSATDCAELRGFWQHRYVLGGPRILALGAHAGNLLAEQAGGGFPCTATGDGKYAEPVYGVEADLRQFMGRSGMLIVHGFAARESAPDVYVQEGFGGRLSVARALTQKLDAQLTFAPERHWLEAADLYFCGQYGVCTDDGIAQLAQGNWQMPLEALLLWTSSNAPTDVRRPNPGPGREWPTLRIPRQRWTARSGFAVAGDFTGSDYAYRRWLTELTSTRLVGGNMEVAARVRAGLVATNEVLPPRVLFFSGGPNTMRGTAQNLLGPKVLATRTRPENCAPCSAETVIDPEDVTVRPTGGQHVLEGNIEARVWVGSRLQLAAFLDAGHIARSTFAELPARSEAMISPGIGLRVVTDLGPIRIDLGYDPTGARQYPLFLQQDSAFVLLGEVRYDPYRFDRPSFFKETIRRLQIHMSIGQAF
ncbi:MAG: BamA/TamA family outer membrane protein [Longimicrobiales bacterium]